MLAIYIYIYIVQIIMDSTYSFNLYADGFTPGITYASRIVHNLQL